MKERIENSIEIIKQGKNIAEREKKENEKISKRRTITIYLIPLILMIITAISYILTQMMIFLILFGILMFIVLWGWDSSSRICPKCKKWNNVEWTKNERKERDTKVKKRSLLNKNKMKTVKEKYVRLEGKCKNCNCVFEMEKGRII